MSNFLFMMSLVVVVVLVVATTRIRRDRTELAAAVRERGGQLVQVRRSRTGHPFTDTGRGWWVWQVRWRHGQTERISYALTTREGIKEWKD